MRKEINVSFGYFFKQKYEIMAVLKQTAQDMS